MSVTEEDLQQTRLPSGRGVRFRLLTPDESDMVLKAAGQEISPESTLHDWRRVLGRMGAMAMTVEVTEQKFATPDALKAPEVAWVKFDANDYSKWFRHPKDHEAICSLYYVNHHVTDAETKAIVGESTPVAR